MRKHTPTSTAGESDSTSAAATPRGAWRPGVPSRSRTSCPRCSTPSPTAARSICPRARRTSAPAWRSGVPATCNAAGAGKWKPEHARWLEGARRVVIIADRDAPGFRHAEKVADSLAGLVGEVRVVAAAARQGPRRSLRRRARTRRARTRCGSGPAHPLTAARPEAGAVPFAGEAALDRAGTAGARPLTTLRGSCNRPEIPAIRPVRPMHSPGPAAPRRHGRPDRQRVLDADPAPDAGGHEPRGQQSHDARQGGHGQWQKMEDAEAPREAAAQFAARRKTIETALEKMRKRRAGTVCRAVRSPPP